MIDWAARRQERFIRRLRKLAELHEREMDWGERRLSLWRPNWRRLLAAAALVIAGVGFGWLWWSGVPTLYEGTVGVTGGDRLKAVTDTRTALLAGLAAVVALGTLWLNNRNYRITTRTFEVTEQGHYTDRYAKAIEHLGSDSVDVRLGGIYALEQIARDSPRDGDRNTIVEVLSAFVRVHSNPVHQYLTARPGMFDTTPAQIQVWAAEYVEGLDGPPVDVQAALTVLGRRKEGDRLRTHFVRTDLTGAYLRKADLTNANFDRAIFAGADLTGARCRRAQLCSANLGGAKLNGALLLEADLRQAHLGDADLTRASLVGANLKFANFTGANLDRTIIRQTDLRRAHELTQDQLDVAIGGAKTMIPEGLVVPSAWARRRQASS